MDNRGLKYNADQVLARGGNSPRRLVLIHTSVTLALSLALTLVSGLLDNTITSPGGLSGLGIQALLDTAQTVLQLVSMVVVPFWSAGLLFAALSCVRQQNVPASALLQGFRRWKPILSSSLLQGIQYIGAGLISMYLSSALFMLTPFAAPMYAAAEQLMADPSADVYALLGDSLVSIAATYMAIFLVVYAVFALPIFYRYRMVNYLILDNAPMGGMQAMLASRAMMKGRRMELFKLDLSFWWFYVLDVLVSLLAFGDLILSSLGITLPVSEDVIYWGSFLLYLAAQLALYAFAKPKLEVTYALAYEAFRQPQEVQPPQPPKNQPWNY